MSVKDLLSQKPQKISPVSAGAAAFEQNHTHTLQKTMNRPASMEPVVEKFATPAWPQKKAVHPWNSTGAKGHAAATGIVGMRALLQNEERTSAKKLRKIKRRLFLEAVHSEQPICNRSPRNVARLEIAGKRNRTGRE